MADLRLQIDIRVTPRVMRWGLAALLLSAGASELASENLTLSTYYPAPSGIYAQMITTGKTWLGRNGGEVGVGRTFMGALLPSAVLHVSNSDANFTNAFGPDTTVMKIDAVAGNFPLEIRQNAPAVGTPTFVRFHNDAGAVGQIGTDALGGIYLGSVGAAGLSLMTGIVDGVAAPPPPRVVISAAGDVNVNGGKLTGGSNMLTHGIVTGWVGKNWTNIFALPAGAGVKCTSAVSAFDQESHGGNGVSRAGCRVFGDSVQAFLWGDGIGTDGTVDCSYLCWY